MANTMYGISALDPLVAATEKFIQEKQIPAEQVPDFLLQMGADPKLAGLVFKARRVQQAAQQQQQPAPASTVNQDVSNQYAQLKQQERMQQGVAAMPAPAIANAPMQGGITGQPTPMASGGVVALAHGGSAKAPAKHFGIGGLAALSRLFSLGSLMGPIRRSGRYIRDNKGRTAAAAGAGYLLWPDDVPEDEVQIQEEAAVPGLTEEQYALIRSAKQEGAGATGSSAMPGYIPQDLSIISDAITKAEERAPKSEKEAIENELSILKESGALEGLESRRKALAEQKEKAVTSPEKKFWLSFAQAGFAASAKGARDLWETLAMGGVEGMKAYESMKEKEAQTLEKIADKELEISELLSNKKLMATKDGRAAYKDAMKDIRDLKIQKAAQQNININAKNSFNLGVYQTEQRADIARANAEAIKQSLEVQHADAISKSMDPNRSPEEREVFKVLARQLLQEIGNVQRQRASVQSTEMRLGAENQFMNPEAGSSSQPIDLGSM